MGPLKVLQQRALALAINIRVKVTDSDKHSSLLRCGITCRFKSFTTEGSEYTPCLGCKYYTKVKETDGD